MAIITMTTKDQGFQQSIEEQKDKELWFMCSVVYECTISMFWDGIEYLGTTFCSNIDKNT